jgi:hypothetical protein
VRERGRTRAELEGFEGLVERRGRLEGGGVG